jgi:hypothetical protein
MPRCCRELGANGTENDLVGYSSPTCPRSGSPAPTSVSACAAPWFVFSSIWEMQHISRFALRQVDWPLCDQIVPVIGESLADRFRRSTVDLQTGAVPEANAPIAAVHDDEVHWPRPSGIDLRHQNPTRPARCELVTYAFGGGLAHCEFSQWVVDSFPHDFPNPRSYCGATLPSRRCWQEGAALDP